MTAEPDQLLPWLLVVFIISRAGWHTFAMRYPAAQQPPGEMYNSPVTRFGIMMPARYSGVVRIVFTNEGLYFSVMFLFRAFHAPFLVPWRSVKQIESTYSFLLLPHYKMEIESEAGRMHVTLPVAVDKELYRFKKKGLTPVLPDHCMPGMDAIHEKVHAMNDQRRCAVFPTLKRGFTFAAHGRTGFIYYKEGARILEIAWEMSGVPQYEILIAPLRMEAWTYPVPEAISEEKKAEIMTGLREFLRMRQLRADF